MPLASDVSQRLRGNPLYDPALLGRIVHELIGLLALAFPPDPQCVAATIDELVGRAVSAPVYRIGLRARLSSAWSRYATEFAPPAAATLVGREVRLSGGRLDLLWQLRSSFLFADEVKTTPLGDSLDGDLVEAQLRRQLAGALARFGDCFLGVRLVRLTDPAASLFLDRDGQLGSLAGRRFE